jgi:hypothetical protein
MGPEPSWQAMVPEQVIVSVQAIVPESYQQLMVPEFSQQVMVPESSQQVMVPESSQQVMVPGSSRQVMVPELSPQVMVPEQVMVRSEMARMQLELQTAAPFRQYSPTR